MLENNRIIVKMNLPIYIFISFYLFSTIRSFLRGTGLNNDWILLFIGIILYIPLLALIIKEHRKICYINIFLFFAIIAYIYTCKWLYPNYSIYYHETNGIENAILTGCSSIFALLFVGLYFDEENMYEAMKYTAIINLFINLLKMRMIMTKSQAFLKSGYDMDFGYKVLFSCIVFLSIYLHTRKRVALILCFFSLILLLLFGSRGPVLCIVVYVFLYYIIFRFNEYSFKKKTVILFCFGFFLLLSFIYYSYIAPMIDVSNLPRSLRAVINIRYSDGTNESRVMIQKRVWEIVKNNGFFGSGLLSDQAYLGPGFYSHNLFIEFIVTFGKIPGLVVFIILILRSVFILRDNSISNMAKNIYLIFLSLCFRLMVSYSFWYDINFWCFLAVGNIILSKARLKTINQKKEVI